MGTARPIGQVIVRCGLTTTGRRQASMALFCDDESTANAALGMRRTRLRPIGHQYGTAMFKMTATVSALRASEEYVKNDPP